ncbi:IclR family transcriptional regulator [Paenarthrobacter nitroguajacolicus]|nr:IclR family transcriptional regulator [Paenarthrobacter nitroguajacolicus]
MSQTVARALEIIRFVSLMNRSLSEVAEHLQVHKSTALRLLQTLEEGGFVRRSADGRFTMGFELIGLGQIALEQVEARTIAHRSLVSLAEREGHTVHFAQLLGDRIVYVDKIDGRGTVAMGSKIGLAANVHTAGIAKAITAFQEDDTRAKLMATADFKRYTDTTIVSPEAFIRELDTIRERGWAEDDGEYEDYINCVAVPVRDARGLVAYGLSVTALRAVAPLERLRADIPQIQQTASTISLDLGWKGAKA